jgi:hypothetical protein
MKVSVEDLRHKAEQLTLDPAAPIAAAKAPSASSAADLERLKAIWSMVAMVSQ